MANKKIVKATCFVFSIMLAVFSQTNAQISLNSIHFASIGTGTDSLRVSLHNATLPSLPAAANGSWDLTGVVDSLTYVWNIRVPSVTTQYADSNKYTFGAYGYLGNAGVNITGGGIVEVDVAIEKKEYNLTSLTAYPFDTLTIPEQTVTYSSPLVHLVFPATYGSVWQSDYTASTVYELTVAIFSYVHKPIVRRTYTQRKDTVRGWGEMRVRNASGFPSDYFDVLQVHSTAITTDSFFVDGVPAMPTVLAMFSLEQGKKDTTYTQRYYRAQEVTPLATIGYKDARYTQPAKATTHIQRLIAVGVNEATSTEVPIVFPNPVNYGNIYLGNFSTNGNTSFLLSDMFGQTIYLGFIDTSVMPNKIELPKWLTNGLYILSIGNDDKPLRKYSIVINK